MAERLKNTLAFSNLAAGASIDLVHGLCTSRPRPLAPDIIYIPSADLAIDASTNVSVTLRNTGLAPLSGNLLVEAWHTIERAFSAVSDEDLPVKPYVVVSVESNNQPPTPPYPDSAPVEITVFARLTGSDASGRGTLASPYRTFKRAIRDVPHVIPPGYIYTVDITGIGLESLPAGYGLPHVYGWRGFADAPLPFGFGGSTFNIRAFPQPASNIPLADTDIPLADIASVTVDPVTTLVTVTTTTPRASWAADSLKGKQLIEDGSPQSSCAIAGSDATHLYLCSNTASTGVADLHLVEPSATLEVESGSLFVHACPHIAFQGIAIHTQDPGPYRVALDYGFGNVPQFTLCEIQGLSGNKVGSNFQLNSTVIRDGMVFFDEASFSISHCLMLNVPVIWGFGANGTVFVSSVLDECSPLVDIPVYTTLGNYPSMHWGINSCLFKNGVADFFYGPVGQIWALNGSRFSLQNVQIDYPIGPGIRVEGPSFVILENTSGTSLDYGVLMVDDGRVRVLDDATDISGGTNDMKVGSLAARSWTDFRTNAPIKNEFDMVGVAVGARPAGDEAPGGPTTGARLYQKAL
jgi:hypothetical protein